MQSIALQPLPAYVNRIVNFEDHREELTPAQLLERMRYDDDEWMVIGECSYWAFQNGTESDARMRVLRGFVRDPETQEIVGETLMLGVAESHAVHGHPLILNNSAEMENWLSANWVGFTNGALKHIGWRRALEPLSYEDHEGEVVAKTICWRDGQFGTERRYSDHPRGIGSSLAIRRQALTDFKKLGSELSLVTQIEYGPYSNMKKARSIEIL